MIRYDKRHSGFCINHYDKSKRTQRMIEYNKKYKKKLKGTHAKDLNLRTSEMPHILVICDICNNAYLASPDALSKGGANCCSSRCVGINAAKKTPRKDTSIEIAIEKELKERNILYQKQVSLCGVTIADFFIPEFNIVIFCDGEYWHNLPKAKARNKKQNQVLRRNGCKVFRFSEEDIKESPSNCLNQIDLLSFSARYQLRLPTFE